VADKPIIPQETTPDGYAVAHADQFDVDLTSVRVHELALNHWLYHSFFVDAGYPIPVVFATPMDAFSEFDRLFAIKEGPFEYLRKLPNEPYPSNVRYPLISVNRRGWAFRPSQNYSSRVERRFDWLNEPLSSGITVNDLSSVRQERMAMAWDFRFEVNHYAMRMDTQAFFVQRLMRLMQYTAGQPQVYLWTLYPGHNPQFIRTFLEGNIDDVTEKSPGDNSFMVYRTSCTLVMEGYSYDNDKVTVPTVWRMMSSAPAVSPTTLDQAYSFAFGVELRTDPPRNPVLLARSPLPPFSAELPGGGTV
jgi:hypothetical protein